MFNNLVAYDHQAVPQPGLSLAERWEVETPTTLVMNLRRGVKFHDGSDFDASVAKWNLERVLNPEAKSPGRAEISAIETVEVVDSHTLKLHLKRPSGSLLALMGGRGGFIVSKAAFERLGDRFGANPVGSGPFKFVEWASGSHVTVERNSEYWQPGRPFLDRVTIRVIPDATVVTASLQTGQIDLGGVAPADVERLSREPHLNIVEFLGSGVAMLLAFNEAMEPVNDVNVRRAIRAAIDPAAINHLVHFDRAIIARGGMFPPSSWAHTPVLPEEVKPDLERAREYLRQAGKADGLSMNVITYSSPTIVQQTEVLKEQLAQVGIRIEVEVRDVGTATSLFWDTKAYPMYSTSFTCARTPTAWPASCTTAAATTTPARSPTPSWTTSSNAPPRCTTSPSVRSCTPRSSASSWRTPISWSPCTAWPGPR